MAQILQSLSYKVCSTLLPKFVATESSLHVLLLGKSAIFNCELASMFLQRLGSCVGNKCSGGKMSGWYSGTKRILCTDDRNVNYILWIRTKRNAHTLSLLNALTVVTVTHCQWFKFHRSSTKINSLLIPISILTYS